jgi:uncharacterized membrane protein
VVAVLAGLVGMIALASSRSVVLVGVLISVTTIPAAANVGVALIYRDLSEALCASAQLLLNVLGIVLAGLGVLFVDRRARLHRLRERRSSASG